MGDIRTVEVIDESMLEGPFRLSAAHSYSTGESWNEPQLESLGRGSALAQERSASRAVTTS